MMTLKRRGLHAETKRKLLYDNAPVRTGTCAAQRILRYTVLRKCWVSWKIFPPTSRKICACGRRFCTISRSNFARKSTMTAAAESAQAHLRWRENFLTACGYAEEDLPRITKMIVLHHCYDKIDGKDLQLLVEADLIAGCTEEDDPSAHAKPCSDRLNPLRVSPCSTFVHKKNNDNLTRRGYISRRVLLGYGSFGSARDQFRSAFAPRGNSV